MVNGGLASIPVFDIRLATTRTIYHYQWYHFAVRERMIEANGHADNHVMWRGSARSPNCRAHARIRGA